MTEVAILNVSAERAANKIRHRSMVPHHSALRRHVQRAPTSLGNVLIGVGTIAGVVGLGMYLNRYVSAWRFRDDPAIMRFALPMSRIGIVLLGLGVILFVIGAVAAVV